MTLVLDASVAIKLYVAEDDSAKALEWLARDVPFIAPDLLLTEVAQALLRHCRESRLSRSQVGDALEDLGRNVAVPVPTRLLLLRAIDFAQVLNHGLHDFMYLALAAQETCGLLTADEALARKVNQARLPLELVLLTQTTS